MKNIPIVTVTMSLTLILALSGCQPESQVREEIIRPINAIKLNKYKEEVSYKFPGIAKATQEAELSFRVSGTLKSMSGQIGKEVAKGEALASLDKRDFEVNVERSKANLAIAEANLKNAKLEYERVEKIQSTSIGAVSQSTIDQRLAAYDGASASFDLAKAELNSMLDRLQYTTLQAPFRGTLVHRYVENYQEVIANNPIYRFVDISKIEMDVNLPENQLSAVSKVNNVFVSFDAHPDVKIVADIKEISNEASQMTRTYKVRLVMTPPENVEILPGMSGVANFSIKQNDKEDLYMVPMSSLFTSSDGGASFIWKFDNNTQTVTKVEVEKVKLTEKGVTIKGVRDGDLIVSAGVNYLKEGQKVRLLAKDGASL